MEFIGLWWFTQASRTRSMGVVWEGPIIGVDLELCILEKHFETMASDAQHLALQSTSLNFLCSKNWWGPTVMSPKISSGVGSHRFWSSLRSLRIYLPYEPRNSKTLYIYIYVYIYIRYTAREPYNKNELHKNLRGPARIPTTSWEHIKSLILYLKNMREPHVERLNSQIISN